MSNREKAGKILGKKTVFQKGGFKVISINYRTPSGRAKELFSIPRKNVVVIIPIRSDGKFVLVDQFRPQAGMRILSFPAGKIDGKKEKPLSAAKRELLEEAGYSAKKIIPLGKPFLFAPASGKEKIHVFLAKGLAFSGQKPDWDEEGIRTKIVSEKKLLSLALAGKLTANHLSALFLYFSETKRLNAPKKGGKTRKWLMTEKTC